MLSTVRVKLIVEMSLLIPPTVDWIVFLTVLPESLPCAAAVFILYFCDLWSVPGALFYDTISLLVKNSYKTNIITTDTTLPRPDMLQISCYDDLQLTSNIVIGACGLGIHVCVLFVPSVL